MSSRKQSENLRQRVQRGSIERRSGLFNGYVRSPGPVVFFPLLVGVMYIALSIFSVKELVTHAIPEALYTEAVNIIDIYEDGPLLVFATENQEFCVLASAAEGKEQILSQDSDLILLVEHASSTEKRFVDIWEIQDRNGEVMVSVEEIYAAGKQRLIVITAGLCSFTAFWFAAMLFEYFILSNAPKYPRLAGLLIRKEFRNW